MPKPFSVNVSRFDPYKSYRFLVYFDTSTSPVAGVSKISSIKRSSDVVEYKEGGNAIIRKGLGRQKYEPITLERVGNAITLGMVTARKDNPAAQDAVFSQAFAIPPDAKPGSYQVRATSPDGDTASADLTVTEPTAAATAGAAMERMASGELQVLDRSKPLAETVGFAVVAAIAGVAGVWLARRSDA